MSAEHGRQISVHNECSPGGFDRAPLRTVTQSGDGTLVGEDDFEWGEVDLNLLARGRRKANASRE